MFNLKINSITVKSMIKIAISILNKQKYNKIKKQKLERVMNTFNKLMNLNTNNNKLKIKSNHLLICLLSILKI